MSMITATVWVPRGHAAPFPTKYNVDDEELARISKLAKLKLEDAKEDLVRAQTKNNDEDENDSDNSRASIDGMNEDVKGVDLARSKE